MRRQRSWRSQSSLRTSTAKTVSDLSTARGITLDGTNVYVTSASQLLRVGKDGTGLQVLASNQSVIGAPAVDATRVYWPIYSATTPVTATLMTMPKDATRATSMAPSAVAPVALAGDASGVYWLTPGDANGSLAWTCN